MTNPIGVRFVFDSSDECTIVHSALYSCLRAVFGLSVAGVLVAVFSCMLVYQLLSHERKKMYWEQLELRCRSLYAGPQGPPPPPPPLTNGPSIIGTPRNGPCRCCEQCHSHRNMLQPGFPWENDNRFWTPVPGTGGNFYSPNPGGDEHLMGARAMAQNGLRAQRAGWSWPRLPWQRNDAQRFRQTPSSPDSQYGFSNQAQRLENANIMQAQTGYTVINGSQHYGVWGPPPPYSDPNSPARRGRYQYNIAQCQQILDHTNITQPIQQQQIQQNIAVLECHQHATISENHVTEPMCQQQNQVVHRSKKHSAAQKAKDNYENTTPSDSDNQRENQSNTLPFRKAKKKVDGGAKSIGPNQSSSRVNVQNVFSSTQNMVSVHRERADTSAHGEIASCSSSTHYKKKSNKSVGVENSGFQSVDENKIFEPTESEVYFADVSSCCNNSVKNDNFYDETTRNKNRLDENEDYLAQRFGKRETSIRSRLPFPQVIEQDYEKPTSLNVHQLNTPARNSKIQKDISRQSMCSMESGEKTDFTDLSPMTPSTSYNPPYPMQESNYQRDPENKKLYQQQAQKSQQSGQQSQKQQQQAHFADFSEAASSNFVALFPYASNEQSQEAHRRSTKNLPEILLNTDCPFEDTNMIMTPKKASSSSTGNYSLNNSISSYHEQSDSRSSYNERHHHRRHHHPQQLSPSAQHHQYLTTANVLQSPGHSLNVTPNKRKHKQHSGIPANIASIIQTLGDRDLSLLYPENIRDSDFCGKDCATNDIHQLSSDNEWSDQSSGDRRL